MWNSRLVINYTDVVFVVMNWCDVFMVKLLNDQLQIFLIQLKKRVTILENPLVLHYILIWWFLESVDLHGSNAGDVG